VTVRTYAELWAEQYGSFEEDMHAERAIALSCLQHRFDLLGTRIAARLL
jgi:hypothetical protein